MAPSRALTAAAGSTLRVAIVHARWNATIIGALLDGAVKGLRAHGVPPENIHVADVPGSFELPFAARGVIQQGATGTLESRNAQDRRISRVPFDVVVAIGVLIKGETMHFEYIADAVSHGLMRAQMDGGTPVVFGLLTVLGEEQGLARAGLTAGGHNHGEDWGAAAVELGRKNKDWGMKTVE